MFLRMLLLSSGVLFSSNGLSADYANQNAVSNPPQTQTEDKTINIKIEQVPPAPSTETTPSHVVPIKKTVTHIREIRSSDQPTPVIIKQPGSTRIIRKTTKQTHTTTVKHQSPKGSNKGADNDNNDHEEENSDELNQEEESQSDEDNNDNESESDNSDDNSEDDSDTSGDDSDADDSSGDDSSGGDGE